LVKTRGRGEEFDFGEEFERLRGRGASRREPREGEEGKGVEGDADMIAREEGEIEAYNWQRREPKLREEERRSKISRRSRCRRWASFP
jgi:hypothetical protein